MPMAHHTLRIQWFEDTWLTKQYEYNGLNVRGSPNVTYTLVWRHIAHQIVQIQLFAGTWLTKRYIYIYIYIYIQWFGRIANQT